MPATSKTRAELVDRALRKLGVLASGQSPEDEDIELIDNSVDAVLADLAERSVYYVSDEAEIPVSAFEWLADILADAVSLDFGKPHDPQMVMRAEAKLLVLKRSGPSYEVLKSVYY